MTGQARRPRWAGFALVEVIVALAVLLILAAVALPQIAGYLDQKRIEQTAEQLVIVRDALFKTGTGSIAFRQAVSASAGRLSQLTIPITTSDRDICGNTYNTGDINRWDDAGPYVNFVIDATTGMATPIGLANNAMVRFNDGGTIKSRITWTNASLSDAQALDLHVDGVVNYNAGTVRWTPQNGVNGVVTTLFYDVVIDGTCA
ncbi:MAG TPA: prepilin-type N-terminal cleavage/methylation domain-containing protein [Gemmatimonadaceae bacterium]|nr:prepilin-type N-terminal cleavage/methylation domain-containing protein [Gemmatimonadaceae bacterium]